MSLKLFEAVASRPESVQGRTGGVGFGNLHSSQELFEAPSELPHIEAPLIFLGDVEGALPAVPAVRPAPPAGVPPMRIGFNSLADSTTPPFSG